MAGATPETEKLLTAVAAGMRAHLSDLTGGIWEQLLAELGPLRDGGGAGLLQAGMTAHVATLLDVFEYGVPLDTVEGPAAAHEYARRLAQSGTPVHALIRAYRLGHRSLLQACLAELHRQCIEEEASVAATSRMLALSFDYIDRVTEQVIDVYQRERDRWLRNECAGRTARVRDILAAREVDLDGAESALGYRLRQHHLGLVAWLPTAHDRADVARLDRFTSGLAELLDCPARPLFVGQGRAAAWAWLPLGSRDRISWARLSSTVENADPSVRVCAGSVEPGIEGFRRTHRQALRVQELTALASPDCHDCRDCRCTAYARVAPIAMMSANIDDLRSWVRSVLGPLADDDEHCARLRETLRVFLDTGCSYTATGSSQILHRNTVQYRIRKAEEAMGYAVQERRTDLDVALLAVEHLGSVLLRKSDTEHA
ncbi:helix-turn-helix domain-containing protein [Streptomyces sp. NPDC001795]|uniref:PucR family transcriptional regulator n=1 Tax=Streptomyces sp. NPDC001795 TaxID=3154525 RepID=UPI003329CF41